MRVFLNDYYDTEYDEISLRDLDNILTSCTSKEDVRFYIKHSSDDTGYMELPFNLGKKVLSMFTVETIGTINTYPDTPETHDYGFEIRIDL